MFVHRLYCRMFKMPAFKYNGNSCENEVDEDLEDGEIFDEEDDIEMAESTEQNTEPKVSKENRLGEGAKEKDFEPPWEMEQRSQQSSHQQMIHTPSHKNFTGFNNSRPRDRFPRNKGAVMKRDVGYQMDDDRPRRKRRRFDQSDEKEQPMLRNNQNGLFNRRKNNDSPMEPVEAGNDEEIPYVRGTNSPDVSNFESFPQEFENEDEFRPSNNFSRRGRGRRGGGSDMDRRNRGMPMKRRMIGGSAMKNKRSEDEEKVCQYFLQGKCLKENNCTYSHQQPNGRKMELCKFYLMDCCSKEDRCTFMHSEFPCKYYHTGMKCYSGVNCRFSHAKLDEDQKKKLLKSFGKLRYDPPEYEIENEDFKNNFEEEPKPPPSTETNFVSKNDKSKIPSLLEMQIPVPPELKSTEKNSDEDQEANNNNNNSSTPMPSPSREEPMVDDTFEINETEQVPNMLQNNRSIYKPRKYQKHKDSKEKQKQEKEIRKKQREERHEEKRIEKNRQRKEDLSMQTNDHPLLDDLSDDDEFNDLVIDEEKFQNDVKDQLLPKKQKELLKRIQVHQKYYNETDISDDRYSQEEQYSSDVSDNSTPINNALNNFQNEEKEQSPTHSSSKLNSSKVEQVNLDKITISDDMAKLLNTIKACADKSTTGDQPSPFHLPALEQPYNFEETIQEKISIIEESPASPTASDSCAVEFGKSDVDLRQLPFQFPVAAATEIDASLDSHPPMKYQMSPTQVSVPDYSKIPPTMGIDDPRLRRSITAARDPMFIQNVPTTVSAVNVRPTVAPQKSAPRDPRKPQQDINTCASAIRAPLLPTPNPIQPRPMDSDMRHMPPPIMCPQMMAVPNDPRRKPMVPGDPRQRHRFDVDQRINNINYF
ncbi:zinc finger CCCH domain-containing protein 4 isoform X1 [Acyrthosiphon pisum]|uniref:C3H1-type domain-containing protein n=1 Tax=Acyrthosiphon pisum TaxID=7029 RepID=A0A8R2B8G1_ACYPI|nr:zinc finger CCCH domain-containing protein 4 isoform X1 [Acyrthosiphon pisum]|eukprot:XP_008186178.1 PREDICTED: zinc finger CCCH domain-containing protein 4 isoform X1 [Acyrthosiphon pisum]